MGTGTRRLGASPHSVTKWVQAPRGLGASPIFVRRESFAIVSISIYERLLVPLAAPARRSVRIDPSSESL